MFYNLLIAIIRFVFNLYYQLVHEGEGGGGHERGAEVVW